MPHNAIHPGVMDGATALAVPLERLYVRYNRAQYISPDPLECLARYTTVADREIAGLVASGLAFGNVQTILRSTHSVLARMPRPAAFLDAITERQLGPLFDGFRHRYVTGADVTRLLWGIKQARARHGSLEGLFAACLDSNDATILPALGRFSAALRGDAPNYLLPVVEKNSACKRLHLFLRWMVRCDAVDPGGWRCIGPASLIMPMDTHSHRIARVLGLTRRAAADARTALEVTEAFRAVRPDDPVRYDFVLTRLGIRTDTDRDGFLRACGHAAA